MNHESRAEGNDLGWKALSKTSMIFNKKHQTGKKSRLFLKAGFFLVLIIIALGLFLFGYSLGQKGQAIPGISLKGITNTEVGKPAAVDFSLFWEAWNKLQQKAVIAPDSQKMLYGAILGMFSSLDDPYTTFFTPAQNQRFKEDIQGEFSGIGVEIVSKNGLPTVVAPLSETPAERAGLKPNDIILQVDDIQTKDIGFREVIDRIRGEAGTNVKIIILREGSETPITMEITRAVIQVKSVGLKETDVNGKKIYNIKIRQFGDDTLALFESIVDQAVSNKPDGLIIDLRNNPGGYLETAIDLSSYFLDGGVVVIEKDKNNQSQEFKVTKKARLKDFKVVVLVNQGSASASEIFTGALQDRKIGKIIGEKTFGKGSVQELIELSDGSAAKITIAKWLTPNGRTINGEGLEPDVLIVDDPNTTADEQYDKAIEYLVN